MQTQEHENIIRARRRLRQIQNKYGDYITPTHSRSFGAAWNSTLKVDPEGHGLDFLIDDFEERIRPMLE